jgi:hypothetical protein
VCVRHSAVSKRCNHRAGSAAPSTSFRRGNDGSKGSRDDA